LRRAERHWWATIRNADRIVVVADTGIVEQGPHDELVARGGAYSLGAAPD
jgi:ATP-binding cassette subfamily B protein